MSKKEKPLPRPPGQRKFHEKKEEAPILADRLAEAMADGKLGEFVDQEIPDSDQARALVSMMMGMTGMLPPGGPETAGGEGTSRNPAGEKTVEDSSAACPPEDVSEAARAGDMEKLVGLLKREHDRGGDSTTETEHTEKTEGAATISKEDIDKLMTIASDNGLSTDWVILRAIRLYVREYERTGRL